MLTEREIMGLARDVETARRYTASSGKNYSPDQAHVLLVSVEERLWDALMALRPAASPSVPEEVEEPTTALVVQMEKR